MKNTPTESTIMQLLQDRKNAERAPLSIEKVLQTPGLEHLSVLEAQEVVASLQQLARLLIEAACTQKSYSIDNQYIVYLEKKNIAA